MIAALFLLACITLLLDWAQTRYIANHPEERSELNPILGAHPPAWAVNVYFGACLCICAVVTIEVPELYALLFLGGVAFVEAVVVARNARLGVKLQ